MELRLSCTNPSICYTSHSLDSGYIELGAHSGSPGSGIKGWVSRVHVWNKADTPPISARPIFDVQPYSSGLVATWPDYVTQNGAEFISNTVASSSSIRRSKWQFIHSYTVEICDLWTPLFARSVQYSISQEICIRFCCALLCCGYAIVHNEFTWSIYPYPSGLLCWHWGNR